MTSMLIKTRKPLGWLLIIVAVGPLGLSFGLIANPSVGGFIFIGVFAFIMLLGIYLIKLKEANNAK